MTRIDTIPVLSSAVAGIGHDSETNTLAVMMPNGRIYHYEGVTASEHDALMSAESIGKHFGQHIRGKYTSRRMTAQCPSCKSEGWAGDTCGDCGTAQYSVVTSGAKK